MLSDFVFAYRKSCGSNRVLTTLTEDRKKSLDNKDIVGNALTDVSKAFDYIPRDVLITKMSAYRFSMDTLIFMYLKRRKLNVKINNIESLLKILVSGVPQGSILGPILFTLFVNDLPLFIKKSNLANFTDDCTIYAASKDITSLLEILKFESEEAISCFEANHMFANPDRFQAIEVTIAKTLMRTTPQIESNNSVKLLGIEIDNKLLFK